MSDHGFARDDAQLNLFPAFRDAGLFSDDGKGRITEWKAMPWTAGGSVAIVLKDPSDAATRAEVRRLLTALAIEPGNGIDRLLEADICTSAAAFHRVVPGRAQAGMADRLEPDRSRPVHGQANGTHGHLPDLPELRASFFLIGPGVPGGRSLGIIDMRDVAPTLARRLGLALPRPTEDPPPWMAIDALRALILDYDDP